MSRPIHEIESKWQKAWEKDGIYHAADSLTKSKFYGLVEFPYPSGDGLHVGHPRSYTAIDVYTRKQRMEGKNVLYPMGWDAFGLPAENFAIKTKTPPAVITAKNIENFKRQMQSIGLGFDWSREINTTDPKYYKWTQWQFLKFFGSWYDEALESARPIEELPIPKAVSEQGELAIRTYRDSYRMAYKATSTINWCPKDKIGLANEEAVGGVCERCGTPVEKREKEQWMIRITKYAERLLKDLNTVDYLEKIAIQQVNWIGKSEGARVKFTIPGQSEDHSIEVFTTRPDTLFGVTFLAVSPELAKTWIEMGWPANDEIKKYIETSLQKTEQDRATDKKEDKTGVAAGFEAINPANGEKIPIWIADYVLGNYGTGALMGVPGHDERDFAFAEKFGLKKVGVVIPDASEPLSIGKDSFFKTREEAELFIEKIKSGETCWTGEGCMMNSDFLDGLPTWKAKEDMTSWLLEKGAGAKAVTYKLRDWVFSRQRYWGEPIPIIHCEKCGYVPVPEQALPVTLPEVEAYEPTDSGESPLAKIRSWVEVACPVCGGKAERETDTMPNWAGSSWYFLRYCDPHNDTEFASAEKLKYWMPVDLYNGGMEHTTLHLLYSRFWYKFLWDLGLIPKECGSEPYARRRSHGLIMAEGGEKMSKSKGNVVNPDDVVTKYGADTFRVYEMFMGPFDQPVPWDTNGIEGVKRFLDKVWNLFDQAEAVDSHLHGNDKEEEMETLYHQTVKKITEGIDQLQFNTCISQLMILTNAYQEAGSVPPDQREGYVKVLAPFAPHLAEEIWRISLGKTESIHLAPWPTYDPSKLQAATFELVVQVSGKVRDRMTVQTGLTEAQAKELALASEKVKMHLAGKEPKNIIYVPGKLINIVV